jgi:hypothetical protein
MMNDVKRQTTIWAMGMMGVLFVGAAHCGSTEGEESPDWWADGGSTGGSGGATGGSGGSTTAGGAAGSAGAGGSTSAGGTDTGGSAGSSVGGSGGSVPDPGAGAADVIGYWVYTKIIDKGVVTLEREKPLGNGQGLHKFAFASSGRAFYIYNAPTLSDFDHPGTFEVTDDLLTYHEIMKYSCAHPHPEDENSNALNPVATYSHFRKVGADELYFSVERTTGFNNTPFHKSKPSVAPQADEGTWIVFQRITEQEFYGVHMIRVCQGSPTCPCHPDCSSNDLLREPAPLPVCSDTWPYS